MSRRPTELPEDLERLGHHLEAAVAVALRRHSRRQAVVSFVGAVVIAVPFALAGAETDLGPAVGTGPPAPQPVVFTAAPESPANGFILRSVATQVPSMPTQPCLVATGCGVPPNPEVSPTWLGRY